MFGFGVEAFSRGSEAKESCQFPLSVFMGVQLGLLVMIQLVAPLCLVFPKRPTVMSPFICLPALLFQWMWLLLGWVWTFSASSCEFDAPYMYTGMYWMVVAYSIAIPLETLWYVRIYYLYFKNLRLSSEKQENIDGADEGLLNENSV